MKNKWFIITGTVFLCFAVMVGVFYFMFIYDAEGLQTGDVEYGTMVQVPLNSENSQESFKERALAQAQDVPIDQDAILSNTDLSEDAVNLLPFYLREHLQDKYSLKKWKATYISDSYARIGNVDYIRLTIDTLPEYYINCGYSDSDKYWLFNEKMIELLPDDRSSYQYGNGIVDELDNIDVELDYGTPDVIAEPVEN